VDTKSKAILASIDGAHAMGIYDVAWLDDERIVTSSADNTVKLWKVPTAEGPMEELYHFRQAAEGTKADPKK
jgi:WD40 repeat protein